MSNEMKEKKFDLGELEFDSLSGGTEVTERTDLTVSPSVVAPPAPRINQFEESIVLENLDGTLEVIDLRFCSGTQFLRWAETAYPPLLTRRLDPSKYDGEERYSHRRAVVDSIDRFWDECWARRRAGKKKESID